MKYLIIPVILVLLYGLYIYTKPNYPLGLETQETGESILWNDTLRKHVPKYMDTSIVVYDHNGTAIKFSSYLPLLFNHTAMLYLDTVGWRLQRLTRSSMDSLRKIDYPVAPLDRWSEFHKKDTINSYEEKFRQIANKLNMADEIVVYKKQRKMYVKRKGIDLLNFDIDLGRNPMGDKQTEGDGRTPLGIYRLDLKQERSDAFHKSFWISYPNSFQKQNAKLNGVDPGKGVLIHGTRPEKVNARDWTNGCIALQNADMDTLFKHVENGAKIVIYN